jgi:hypothetical protein
MKTMNVVLLIISSLFFTGCATFGSANHDNEFHEVESQYRKDCEHWSATSGIKITTRKAGEENLSIKDVISLRCRHNPNDCNPPMKPMKLIYFENYWNEPLTGEYCSSYHFDEDRLRVYYPQMGGGYSGHFTP